MLIDSHAHIAYPGQGAVDGDEWGLDRAYLEAADILGIDVLVCSCLTPKPATPEIFRRGNDRVLAAMEKWPGRIWMHTYVNPGYCREAIAELERTHAVEDVVGCKLYDDYTCSGPVVGPVVEKCIELGAVIVINQGHQTDHIFHKPHYRSDAGDIVALAKRYPEAKLIADHIGGGGDWEWTVKTLAEAPNVHHEISGSVCDEGMMEMALEHLGADRLLFACDMSLCAGMGKFRALPCGEEDKRKIACGNFLRLCGRA
jgi:predicted TIM-barrel fold metal-dependent hydrolase